MILSLVSPCLILVSLSRSRVSLSLMVACRTHDAHTSQILTLPRWLLPDSPAL